VQDLISKADTLLEALPYIQKFAGATFVVKYGGSLLWATMVFLLVGVLLPGMSRSRLAAIAVAIAIVVEFSRLVHAPWLDAFRLTTAGALLLGRIFSLWNLVAYAVGIAFGVWIDGLVAWAKAR